jgi:hypothetical protein
MKLLEFLYPDYDWLFWEFVSAPQNAWDSIKNQYKFLCHKLKDRPPTDLYNYNVREDLPHGLTMKYKSLYELAKSVFPTVKWEQKEFNNLKTVAKIIEYLSETLGLECKPEFKICESKHNGYFFKMDIYIPRLNLIVEIDGPQHFEFVWKTPIVPEIQLNRDILKIKEAQKKGFKCIRLYQPELVSKDTIWLNNNIKPYLVVPESLEPEFLCFNTEKYGDVYNKHRDLYTSGISITFDDCYPKIT